MSKFLKYIACAGLLTFGLSLASCSDDEGVTPSDVTDIRYEAGPGKITLHWNTPDDGTIKYVKVTYYDHLTKQNEVRLASIYADSILIPATRKKYGTYSFTIQSISTSGDGGTITPFEAVSGPAPITTLYGAPTKLTLTASDLSTNAQENTEGPIANLVDGILGNTDATKLNFFHTSWSSTVSGVHYLQVDLPQTFTADDAFRFFYAPRYNAADKPTDFDLMGSMDGDNWFLIKNFTKDADGLPVSSTATFTSLDIDVPQPFDKIRINVNATNSGKPYWTMSEFEFYYVKKTVIDPESPDVDI